MSSIWKRSSSAAGSTAPVLIGRAEECAALDRLLADASGGASRVVVLRGEAGVGKSALLGYVSSRATGWKAVSAAGIESEAKLPFSGLHQLLTPVLEGLGELPAPQRAALETVFGLSAGPSPDRFLIAIAALTMLAEAAERQPLLCVIDDAHRLDEASAQILGFVARRLLDERIAIVCAARIEPASRAFAGLPELIVSGLAASDARALLLENIHGPMDTAVCDQIVSESHGNPLALIELPRALDLSDLAGGFGFPVGRTVAATPEQSHSCLPPTLSADARLLLVVAAADPSGNPLLLRRASQALGLELGLLDAAVHAGLVTVGRRIEFANLLVRMDVYSSATTDERQRIHLALADATNRERDPDRAAWHRACGTSGPDEDVASDLERHAGRAEARAGLAATAAFLRRAAALTADPLRRFDRGLKAAQASLDVGAVEAALELAVAVEGDTLDGLQRARVGVVRGRVASVAGPARDAPELLLTAARQLETVDSALSRETYLDAWVAALLAGRSATAGTHFEISRAARAAIPRARRTSLRCPSDLLLDSLSTLIIEGRAAATPRLKQAAAAFAEASVEENFGWGWLAAMPSSLLWDEESWHSIEARQVHRAREVGALARLPIDLTALALLLAWRGDFEGAASAISEADAVTGTTGVPLLPSGAMLLAALRGREGEVAPLVDWATVQATVAGQGLAAQFGRWVTAILCNGLSRYDDALVAAQDACDDDYELFLSSWALPELIEASVMSRKEGLGRVALERLTQATTAAGTDWALGIEARCRALLSEGQQTDLLYQDAIDRLGRTHIRTELARAHLLYGEWLRREGRRLDARQHLRTAHESFIGIGMEAFAERTRRELVGTGEKIRRRRAETRDDLTPQEEQIARLAREGLSNPEIGARLFISARTVEWHLRKVFTKLGINSRRQLRAALPSEGELASARSA